MTEHRHETKRFIYWNGEYWKQDANGGLTYKLPIVEIERRLNMLERIKETLSAEDAKTLAHLVAGGWTINVELLMKYARILGGEDE